MSESGIRLIVGLGNPGPDYAHTRHNAGFWLLDRLAASHQGQFRAESKFHGMLARITVAGQDLRLLKPTTYMNHSGRAVVAVARYFDVPVQQILVAYDELDLPAGRVKLKRGGGHAGHNGMRDTIAALGSPDFWRLRIGIDHPGHKDRVINYVLGRPSKEDAAAILDAIDDAERGVPELAAGKFQLAMNRLHSAMP
ncbi:aminoacyl-tRNA hydrolase [Thiohalocapsa marina]|uniref:Peptidyl-tRNA hydrolase n=1 Tax=Thiohalocapsa marina TaxID=424902 RepID=A0A5M8FEB2_9GAMM|nr:aminoacyl-tRNA hydrolase [Thiohalocapsa marina]KAA6183228.1 aminoacyl-tRNA hydrolase [Thiohalocapsa marina]